MIEYQVLESLNEVESFFQANLKNPNGPDCIGLDIETSSINPEDGNILLMQFLAGKEIGIYEYNDENPTILLIKEILENPWIVKIIHNAKFEYTWLKSIGITINNIYDSMVAEQILRKGEEGGFYSLEELVKKYCDVELNKSIRDTFINHDGINFTKEQLDYAAEDVAYLENIYHLQSNQIAAYSSELWNIKQMEMQLTPILAEIELAGIKLDVDRFKLFYESNNRKRKTTETKLKNILETELLNKINTEVGFNIKSGIVGEFLEFSPFSPNLASPLQLQKILNILGAKVDSVGESILIKLNHSESVPNNIKKVVELYRKYVEYNKLCSSWGLDYLKHLGSDGRLHPEFHQYVTKSGRLSSSKPNCQQIPRDSELRSCFVAKEGYKLIKADYNSQELRIIAVVSGDEKLISDLKNNIDVYSNVAQQMYHKKVNKNYNKELRDNAKTVVLATNYGASAFAIVNSSEIPLAEAKEIQHTYFELYPQLYHWIQTEGFNILEKGYAITSFGAPRIFKLPVMSFAEMKGLIEIGNKSYRKLSEKKLETYHELKHIMRAGLNHEIQGLAANIIKLALIDIYNKLNNNYDAKIILTVHDEILLECYNSLVSEVSDIVKNSMESIALQLVPQLEIPVEVFVGENWAVE